MWTLLALLSLILNIYFLYITIPLVYKAGKKYSGRN